MMRPSTLLTIFTSLTSATATILHISLPSSHTSALSTSSIGTSAIIHSSPSIRAPLSSNGGFTFDLSSLPSRTEDEYLLVDVNSKDYVFSPLLLGVTPQGDVSGVWEVRRGENWGEKGEGMRSVEVTGGDGDVKSVMVRVLAKREFYEDRQGFSPMSLLKNPMILLAIVALGITFGIPKLLENMDPETRAEFEQAQKQGGIATLMGGGAGGGAAGGNGGEKKEAPMNPANFDLAGWMAGQTASVGGGGSSGGETKTSGSDVRGGGARRR